MTYAYFAWSMILLGLWGVIYVCRPGLRTKMLRTSILTAPLGLSEPLFVPEYWMPPTLFDLAARTGFDIEGPLFAFAIGGVACALYPVLVPMSAESIEPTERHHSRHRWHRLILCAPVLLFIALELLTPWNPIYTASLSMAVGGVLTWLCRPDLWRPMVIGALLFTLLYFIYFSTLVAVYPIYVAQVWQLERLSGWLIAGVPFEELLFAASLGFMWSALYEHLTWQRYLSKAPFSDRPSREL